MRNSRRVAALALGAVLPLVFGAGAHAAHLLNYEVRRHTGDDFQAVQKIDFRIDRNAARSAAFGILGPHGSGKSTTAMSVNMLEEATGGEVAAGARADGGDDAVENANKVAEVIYRYDLQRVYYVDHIEQTVRWEPMAGGGQNPGGSVIAGAPEGADPNQQAMLANMFQQFNKPRVDPKVEIKAQPNGNSYVATADGNTLACVQVDLIQMGGKIGTACFADSGDVAGGDEFLAWLRKHPQWAAGFPAAKDPLWRTLVTGWKQNAIPTRIQLAHGDESDESDDVIVYFVGLEEQKMAPDAWDAPDAYKQRKDAQ